MSTKHRAIRALALMTLMTLIGQLACRPPTEAERYRKALGWTRVDDVKTQLDAGKDPKAPFADGHTPLHVVAASMHGSPEVARLLIERGADVNAKTPEGETPWALVWRDADDALDDDAVGILLALLDAGAAPTLLPADDGETVLHRAARKADSTRLISVLVADHGGDVAAADHNGWTPLHVAMHENHVAAVTGLLEAKADANAETTARLGTGSWHYEAGSRPFDVVRRTSRTRSVRDARKVLGQYGGTANPAVDNKAR